MLELNIQRYLREEGSLERLAYDYAIKSVRHTTFPHLVLLRYDQINSPMAEPLVQECRSIILDEFDHYFGTRATLTSLLKLLGIKEEAVTEVG